MVPTQKSGAQRKKLMNLSFPLKGGSWASSVCTLSGPAAVSEFHTVTTGQFCADRVQHVLYFPSVLPYLLAHLLHITFVHKLTIWKPSQLETTTCRSSLLPEATFVAYIYFLVYLLLLLFLNLLTIKDCSAKMQQKLLERWV